MLKVFSAGWIFWFKWALLKAIAAVLGTMIAAGTSSSIGRIMPETLSGGSWLTIVLKYDLIVLIRAIPGVMIGLIQGSMLQPWVRQQKGWILVTTIGWVLGSALVLLISNVLPYTVGRIVLTGALFGLLFGSIQWLVLQRWINQAYWWIVSGMVSMAIAFLIGQMTMVILLLPDIIGLALMGLPLVWLLPSPRSEVVQLTDPSA